MRTRDPGWKKFGSGIRDGKHSDPGYTGLNVAVTRVAGELLAVSDSAEI